MTLSSPDRASPSVPILPSIRGLQALSRLAGAGTLTAAAASLGVTRSALSHRIADLETELGVALVAMRGRTAVLTEDGETMLAAMGDALQRIEAAVQPLRRRRTRLRVSTVATFATHWLIPHLPAIQAAHPTIEVAISTTTRVVDLAVEDMDCAIRHGRGPWDGLEATLLFRETLMPVATPAVAARIARGKRGLATAPLIQTRSRFRDWTVYWQRAALSTAMPEDSLVVETRSQALEAALAGAGVALTDDAYCARPVRDGRLTRLAPRPLPLEEGYFVVHRPAPRNPRAVRAFRDALVREAAAPQAPRGAP